MGTRSSALHSVNHFLLYRTIFNQQYFVCDWYVSPIITIYDICVMAGGTTWTAHNRQIFTVSMSFFTRRMTGAIMSMKVTLTSS